ncbi:MAG: nitrile hydratase subunit alpha [Deltaproteobacteria bacterium]|nr:nitrile hydratase subunit alpha [Deltaproteobacteria bacterium]
MKKRRPAEAKSKPRARKSRPRARRSIGARYRGSPLPIGEQYPLPESELAARARAIESLLAEKGLVSSDMIDQVINAYEHDIGPMLGAKVVARAWIDPAFKRRLLENATAACAELGIGGMQGEHMICVENTPQVHNVVCCTLCSCYPWPVLGLPPTWYKHPQYRARLVADPRALLRDDFGLAIPDDVEVRVWDSSSEIRYWVLPQRPADTEHLSERQLAALVSRDSMIGVDRTRGAQARPGGSR